MAWIWVQFAICTALIWFAGVRLSRYGHVIAEKSRLSGTWVGLIMLATVTSLPELVTGISSVTLTRSADIAVGDVFGSCVFNLLVLSLLDYLQREKSLFTHASQAQVLSAGFGVVLIGFAGFSIVVESVAPLPSIGHVSITSPIILVLYLVAIRMVFRYERRVATTFPAPVSNPSPLTLGRAVALYCASALVVVAAGTWLPFIGEDLAAAMGWQKTFVGTLFVAAATSTPEVVVTVAALRLGAVDMAVGNLFGSNLFDIAILAIDDIFYTAGPLLADVSVMHAASSMSAVMMTGIAIVGFLYRTRTKLFGKVGWASLLLFAIAVLNSYILFLRGE